MLTGHCLCGNVTYTLDVAETGPGGICHCEDCRRGAGATYSMVITVKKTEFHVKGDYKIYKTNGVSGKTANRYFCPNCGSQIANLSDATDVAWIKVGTLAKELQKDLKPVVEVFTRDRLPFITDRYGDQFETTPPS